MSGSRSGSIRSARTAAISSQPSTTGARSTICSLAQTAWVEKLACSSRPRETDACPVETGVVRIRARARASWARYSRIITPELPAGPDARNAGSPDRDGLIRAESRAADSAITGYVAWRSASRVAESRAVTKPPWCSGRAVGDDQRVLGGVVDLDDAPPARW